ncbi:MAG: hypothetical protein PHF37_08725 [Phycisphaerae bacterium]|nr:hypothetical protein [Phycisphaerae bacterium]
MDENSGQAQKITGRAVYIYAFDLAYDMKREPIGTLLAYPLREYSIEPTKRIPKYMFFHRSQKVELPVISEQTPVGIVEIQRHVQVFNIGAISIRVSIPFAVERLEDLVDYHDLNLGGQSLDMQVYELAESVRQELTVHCIRPVERLREGDAYTVFCFDKLPAVDEQKAEQWLAANRRQIAGLLTAEQDSAYLSEQEAAESTNLYLSYYDTDLVVADWDAALVVESENLDEVLQVMELANVQLAELSAYDRLLDASLESAYRDLRNWRRGVSRTLRQNVREIRIDLARFSDELVNITKFFGDWHLARIYNNLAARLHLADWHRTIDEKLKTLDDLYQIIQQDRTNFFMVVLELTIVLLFILDVVLLLLGL